MRIVKVGKLSLCQYNTMQFEKIPTRCSLQKVQTCNDIGSCLFVILTAMSLLPFFATFRISLFVYKLNMYNNVLITRKLICSSKKLYSHRKKSRNAFGVSLFFNISNIAFLDRLESFRKVLHYHHHASEI